MALMKMLGSLARSLGFSDPAPEFEPEDGSPWPEDFGPRGALMDRKNLYLRDDDNLLRKYPLAGITSVTIYPDRDFLMLFCGEGYSFYFQISNGFEEFLRTLEHVAPWISFGVYDAKTRSLDILN